MAVTFEKALAGRTVEKLDPACHLTHSADVRNTHIMSTCMSYGTLKNIL